MTAAQYELAVLILKGLFRAGEYLANAADRLNKVASMTDEQCRAAIPGVQASIDANDQTIQGL